MVLRCESYVLWSCTLLVVRSRFTDRPSYRLLGFDYRGLRCNLTSLKATLVWKDWLFVVSVQGTNILTHVFLQEALKACQAVNAPSIFRAAHRIPFSVLKYAMTLDGLSCRIPAHSPLVMFVVCMTRVSIASFCFVDARCPLVQEKLLPVQVMRLGFRHLCQDNVFLKLEVGVMPSS